MTIPGVHGLSLATRYLEGGRNRFIEFVQLAVLNNDATAVAWWTVYADLAPYQRSKVSFDDVCAASGVTPADLMSVVVSTAMTIGMDVGNLVAAAMHPKVIDAHVRSAARITGEYADLSQKDRFAFLQSRGLAPLPRNTVVNVHANASASARAASAATAEPTVPSFTDDMSALQAARSTVQQSLIAGHAPDVIDLFPEPEPETTVVVGDE